MGASQLGRSVVAVVAFCVYAPLLPGQTTGDIRGIVKDPSGAVVPHAQVTASLSAAGIERRVTSGDGGEFTIPTLAVGTYKVRIEAPGFKVYEQDNVVIDIGHVAQITASLEIGESTQVITAEAAAPLVETTSTQLGAVMNSTAVANLPLSTRDTYQLLQLQPGVQSQQGYALFAGSDEAGAVSVNGGRGRANNYNVNGGDANDQFLNGPAIQPVPDAIEEFRVLTNTFDAEYGRNSGSVVNVVTKGGTNQFHGDVYEFFRNTDLDARGFFDTVRPQFNQNQYGGTLGGPIKKDRTFFFVTAEGRNVRQGIPSPVVTVPTVTERNGDFSGQTQFAGTLTDQTVANNLLARPGCASAVTALGGSIGVGPWSSVFPTNVIPTACFDPTAAALLNKYVPLPNLPGGQLQTVPVQGDMSEQWTVRVDHRFNDNHQLNAYVYYDDDAVAQPFAHFQAAGADVPGFGSNYFTRDAQYNLTETWTINPSTINVAHFTYFREGQLAYNSPQVTNTVQNSCGTVSASTCFADPNNPDLGIHPGLGSHFEGVPFINISGGFSIGNDSEGQLPQIGNSFSWTDNLSKVVGNHSLKFGADIRRMRFDQTLYYNVNGSYSFNAGGTNDVGSDDLYPDYLLGLPNTYSQGSAQAEHVRSSAFYFFAQDSWKLRPNLTLNYGLRWELNTPLADVSKHVQTFRPGQETSIYPCQLSPSNPLVAVFGTTDCSVGSAGESVNPLGLVFPGDQGVPESLTQTYYKAFAPRIGLAYSPSGDSGWKHFLFGAPGASSVRMGYGIFYNPVEQLVLEQFSAEPPFGGSISLANTEFNTPFEGQDGSVNPNPFNGILNPKPGQTIDWASFRPLLLYGQFQPKLRTQYAEQYNFTLQRQIPGEILMQVAYVGSQGHRLLASHDLNYGDAQTCLDLQSISVSSSDTALQCGPFQADSSFTIPAGAIPAGFTLHLPYGPQATVTGPNANPITLVGLRRYSSPLCNPLTGTGCPPDGVPDFSSIFAEDTIANSNYNSLQISAEKRLSHGLQFQAAYTWSKSIDNASSFENELNPLNYALSRSLSYFDAPQRFVLSFYYELPKTSLKGWGGMLLNGWNMSGILTFQTGFPVPITSSDDYELEYSAFFQYPGEPNILTPFQRMNPRGPGNYAFNPAGFDQPTDANGNPIYGVFGDSSRTVCCGPGINNLDISFLKDAKLNEKTTVEFRSEFFNIANHAQFSQVDGNISDGATFGKALTARDPRLIQFALKLLF